MYRKNVAGQNLAFCLVNASTGAALTGATVTARRSIDGGAQAAATGTVSELANGQYNLALSQADTNGNQIGILLTATSAIPVHFSIVTTAADPTDAAAFGITRIDAAVTSRLAPTTAGRTLDVAATGEAGLDFSNILDASGAHTLTNITVPTVTTVTNSIVVDAGLAAAATANTITLAAALGSNNLPNGATVSIVGGTGRGQTRGILLYVDSTAVATINKPWTVTPDTTSRYVISGGAYAEITIVTAGTAQAGGASTITLAASASANNNEYNGMTLQTVGGTGVGQRKRILSYNGGTKVATTDTAWTTNPDSTTIYEIQFANVPALDANGAVTVATNNDKTGYGLANNAVDAAQFTQAAADKVWSSATRTLTAFSLSLAQSVWDVLAASVAAANSIGLQLKTNIDAAISSRLASGSYTAPPTAAQVSTQVWTEPIPGSFAAGSAGAKLNTAGSSADPWSTAVPGAYGAGTAGNILGNRLDVAVSSRLATTGYTAPLDAPTVKAQVVAAINTDTYAEPSAVPAATATLVQKIGWLMVLARNKITQTATTQTVRNSGDTGNIATSTVSDDGSTFTRGGYS